MRKLDSELREDIDSMVADMGRLERRRAMELYLTGLLLDGERKRASHARAGYLGTVGR